MVPIAGRASSFLETFLFFKTHISIQIKSKSNFCSSFFLCLQGRPELCGSYLLQSCCSFFDHLHGQPEPFRSYYLVQTCSSFFTYLHGLVAASFSCLALLSCSHHHASVFWEWPGAVSSSLPFMTTFSFPLVVFLVILLALSFSRPVLSLSFFSSSVSEICLL